MSTPPPVAKSIPNILDFITHWAAATREGHRFAAESLEHADKMLTWAIGLMGAGIFASREFLSAAPIDLRFAAWLPWIAGIVFAVAGRLFYDDTRAHDNLYHYDRVNRIESLRLVTDETKIRAEVDIIFAGGEGIAEKGADLKRRARRANACFYGAHIFLGLGILSVVFVAYWTAR